MLVCHGCLTLFDNHLQVLTDVFWFDADSGVPFEWLGRLLLHPSPVSLTATSFANSI